MDTDTFELCCEQGFASELLGEVFTKGKGPFGQLGIPLGQPLNSEYAGVALAVWVSTCSYILVDICCCFCCSAEYYCGRLVIPCFLKLLRLH